MPPCCASAIAKFASVTVSIAAEMIGILSSISSVICVVTFVSLGNTSDAEGIISMSSKA